MSLRIRPWFVGALDESGGYDCMSPGVPILDAHNKVITVIDAKDFGWPGYVEGPEIDRQKLHIKDMILDHALRIVSAMNRAPKEWGPWA